MLLALGRRPAAIELVDLLGECHTRIRRFLELAGQLATTQAPPEAEVRATAADIRRYFLEAFPLHLADEDEDIAPRLAGTSSEVDAALATMSADHVDHAPAIVRLVELCARLELDPTRHATLAPALAAAAHELVAQLSPHLELEERVLFPALQRLTAPERQAIQDAVRARRDRAFAAGRR